MPGQGSSRKVIRTRLRRQLRALDRQLATVETTIEEIQSAPGRTNRPDRLQGMLRAIASLRAEIGCSLSPKAMSSHDGRPKRSPSFLPMKATE